MNKKNQDLVIKIIGQFIGYLLVGSLFLLAITAFILIFKKFFYLIF